MENAEYIRPQDVGRVAEGQNQLLYNSPAEFDRPWPASASARASASSFASAARGRGRIPTFFGCIPNFENRLLPYGPEQAGSQIAFHGHHLKKI
jgi:hypothetical protein